MSSVRIFDVDAGDMRDVTQADVDGLMETAQAYAKLVATMRGQHSEHQSRLKAIKTRAAQPVKG